MTLRNDAQTDRHSAVLPAPMANHLPLRRKLRQGTLLFVQRVFDLPLVGAFRLLHVMLWLTAVAFLGEHLP